jgi:hypothetical protein
VNLEIKNDHLYIESTNSGITNVESRNLETTQDTTRSTSRKGSLSAKLIKTISSFEES